jgi:DNA-binding response OmpR family regulator
VPSRSGSATVLVVEDSDTIQRFIARVLLNAGMEVLTAADGEAGVERFLADRPDVVLLDLQLPRLDGWQVLRRLRAVDEGVPVIMLTAVQDEPSKVRGLLGGADDYVVKPVGAGELVARVTAALRRSRLGAGAATETVYEDGRLRVDFGRSEAVLDGRSLALTPLEFRLLAAFVRHVGETLSPQQLMETVWNDYTGMTTAPVKVYVGYLRRKLGDDGALVQTVRGYGYRYAAPQSGRPGVAAPDHATGMS